MVAVGWGYIVERLVGALVVVVVDPRPALHEGMLQGGEALGPAQLLLESLDEALTEAVLLGRVRRDVFLLEALAQEADWATLHLSHTSSRANSSGVLIPILRSGYSACYFKIIGSFSSHLHARKSLSEIVCDPGLAPHHANSMQTRFSAFHFFQRSFGARGFMIKELSV